MEILLDNSDTSTDFGRHDLSSIRFRPVIHQHPPSLDRGAAILVDPPERHVDLIGAAGVAPAVAAGVRSRGADLVREDGALPDLGAPLALVYELLPGHHEVDGVDVVIVRAARVADGQGEGASLESSAALGRRRRHWLVWDVGGYEREVAVVRVESVERGYQQSVWGVLRDLDAGSRAEGQSERS